MIKPLNYKINKVNKELFLYHTASDARDSMKKLLDNIIHISYDTFIQQIKNNLDEVIPLKLEDRPIFVYIDIYDMIEKSRSNYWIYKLIQNYLIQKNIITKIVNNLNDEQLLDDDIILLADDCIYSGNQMSSKILSIIKPIKKINLLLFVPYMSLKGKENIIDAFKDREINFKITRYIKIEPLSTVLTNNKIETITKYYNKLNNINNLLDKYTIYFDHKVADFMSSIPFIFNGLVPNKKNNIIIEKIIKLENEIFTDNIKIKELKQLLDFFPLLTNCEHIKKSIDTYKSKCPFPPYKPNYDKFLEEVYKAKEQREAEREYKVPDDDELKQYEELEQLKQELENEYQIQENELQKSELLFFKKIQLEQKLLLENNNINKLKILLDYHFNNLIN